MFSCVSTFEPKIHPSEGFFLKIEALKEVIVSFYAVPGGTWTTLIATPSSMLK